MLDKYPDIAAVNNLPVNSDPDIARDALATCAIGATRFEEKFSRAQLERMVKRDLETRFKKDPKYSAHVHDDVPGSDVKEYGSRGRTSSKGTFVRVSDYEAGGGLDTLLTGGWLRVAKDRIGDGLRTSSGCYGPLIACVLGRKAAGCRRKRHPRQPHEIGRCAVLFAQHLPRPGRKVRPAYRFDQSSTRSESSGRLIPGHSQPQPCRIRIEGRGHGSLFGRG